MGKFDTLDYLSEGNPKQKKVYQILTSNRVMDILADYSPILTGTIPIAVDTEKSDLDIICHWTNIESFKSCLMNFSHYPDFELYQKVSRGYQTVIARFLIEDLQVEIYEQNRPTKEQEAFKHMVVENRILIENGEEFRKKVVELKRKGVKTEVAFGTLLGIKENHHEELLKFYQKNDDNI